MIADPLPGMDDESLGCVTARRLRGGSRQEKESAEGSDSEGEVVPLVRGRATTDPRAGGRAEDGAGQGSPLLDDLGRGGRSHAGKRRRRSTRARAAIGDTSVVRATVRSQARDRLTDEDREWVRRTVANMGPLADEDRDYLALIFKNHR